MERNENVFVLWYAGNYFKNENKHSAPVPHQPLFIYPRRLFRDTGQVQPHVKPCMNAGTRVRVYVCVWDRESESESAVRHRLASYVHKSRRVEAHCSLLWPSRLCFHSAEASSAEVRLRPVCWNSRHGLNHPVTAVKLPNVVIVHFLVIRFHWFKIGVIIYKGKRGEYKS